MSGGYGSSWIWKLRKKGLCVKNREEIEKEKNPSKFSILSHCSIVNNILISASFFFGCSFPISGAVSLKKWTRYTQLRFFHILSVWIQNRVKFVNEDERGLKIWWFFCFLVFCSCLLSSLICFGLDLLSREFLLMNLIRISNQPLWTCDIFRKE